MHSFQEVSVDYMDMNPFKKIGKDWMLVTAGDEEKANSMTASWGAVGEMWGKDSVFVFIRQSRFTKEFIDKKGKFSLSFPGEEYRRDMKYLGTVSGRDVCIFCTFLLFTCRRAADCQSGDRLQYNDPCICRKRQCICMSVPSGKEQ